MSQRRQRVRELACRRRVKVSAKHLAELKEGAEPAPVAKAVPNVDERINDGEQMDLTMHECLPQVSDGIRLISA
jgi:hypothetical protein